MNIGAGRSILIVEDSADLQLLLFKMVQFHGFEVVTCSSGQEAFTFLANNRVDLIVSDIQMPGGSGIWLLNQLRTSGNKTPLILITSDTTPTTAEALAMGANGFLRKPFDRPTLRRVIGAIVEPEGSSP